MGKAILFLSAVAIYLGPPALMLWGWARWVKRPAPRTLPSALSLIALMLATVSAIIALATSIYAQAVGGFPYYDPLLLKIYRIGILLALGAVLISLGGVWRPNPIRWHALASGLAMILFWFASAMSE